MHASRRSAIAFATTILVSGCESSVSPHANERTRAADPPVAAKSLTLVVGEEHQLSAVNSTTTVVWKSNDPTVVSVSENGILFAHTPGTTSVIAGKAVAETTLVKVRNPAAAVQLLSDTLSIALGASTQLAVRVLDASGAMVDDPDIGFRFKWSSASPDVATVDSVGVVSARTIGRAKISVAAEGKTDSTIIDVVDALISTLTVSAPAEFSLSSGASYSLHASARDAAGNELSGRAFVWSTSNAAVVAVAKDGSVTAISPGSAQISVSSGGRTASVLIRVLAPTPPAAPAASRKVVKIGVVVTPSSSSVGRLVTAVATAFDSTGGAVTGKSVTWSVLDPVVASISPAGLVTPLSPGATTVRATIDGVIGQASLIVSAPTLINAPTATPGTLVSHDFEDGSFGPMYNPWATGIDVVDDPSSSGHGKVARFHFATNGTTQADDNKALLPRSAAVSRGLGQELWFQADFFLDPKARLDASGPGMVQRKLLRFGWDGMSFPHPLETELTTFGPQFVLVFQPEQAFTLAEGTELLHYVPTSVAKLTAGQWHRIKMYQKLNSAYGTSDGVLQLWYDGILIFDRSDMRWSDPSWTDIPTTYLWNSWALGYQVSAAEAVDEYRYWDNVIFSGEPIQP